MAQNELHLPGILAEIAELAGVYAAAAVAQAKGGARAYIPAPESLKPEHWLAVALGLDKALEFAARYRGEIVEIPLGPWAGNKAAVDAAIKRGIADGKSAPQIAREVGVTERTVTNHKRKTRRVSQQYSLFS